MISKKEFTYFSVMASEEKMMNDLESVLDENQVETELSNKIKIAVSEGFTNALLHANKLDKDKKIQISIEINENGVYVDIIDEGVGGLAKIRNKKPPTLVAENGRGVDLIGYYANRVLFKELSSGGLKVSMEFDRKKSKITN